MINFVPLNPGKMRHIFLLMTMLLYISGEGYFLIECTSIDTEASGLQDESCTKFDVFLKVKKNVSIDNLEQSMTRKNN